MIPAQTTEVKIFPANDLSVSSSSILLSSSVISSDLESFAFDSSASLRTSSNLTSSSRASQTLSFESVVGLIVKSFIYLLCLLNPFLYCSSPGAFLGVSSN